MEAVDITTILEDFKGFLQRAESGEKILIYDQDRLLAKLRFVPARIALRESPVGIYEGLSTVTNGHVESLPEEVTANSPSQQERPL